MRVLIDGTAVTHAAGDVRELSAGDRIMMRREATQRPDWAIYWDAIGVAIARGAELKVYD